jgi:hypothetical protein
LNIEIALRVDIPEAARYGISTVSFGRGSKGIAGNGDASRVWKGEMAQIASAFGHLLSRCPFFIHKIRSIIQQLYFDK